jgi:putative Holliday junction resolvase
MGRILAIDYGSKRCGLAVTDPTQTIATALETVATATLLDYLNNYILREPVERFILGEPKRLNNTLSATTEMVHRFSHLLAARFPHIPVQLYDERFTSKMASQSLLESGQSRKTRRDKSILDQVSATILLQDYLNSIPKP